MDKKVASVSFNMDPNLKATYSFRNSITKEEALERIEKCKNTSTLEGTYINELIKPITPGEITHANVCLCMKSGNIFFESSTDSDKN